MKNKITISSLKLRVKSLEAELLFEKSSLQDRIKELESELDSCRLQLEVYRDLAGSYERAESKLVIEVNELKHQVNRLNKIIDKIIK